MTYLARSLFQEYLIVRDDFSKLKDTYQAGRYVLKYKEQLPPAEYSKLLYSLAVHAHVIREYEDSVNYCRTLLASSEKEALAVRSYVIDVLRSAHFYLGNYELAEKYAEEYRRCVPSIEGDNDRLLTAMINAKRGHIELATEQFERCLQLCSNSFIVYIVNAYVSLCFERDHIDKIKNLLLSYEVTIHDQTYTTPMRRGELAKFYKTKGDYYSQTIDIDRAISEYIEGAYAYACIDDVDNERECLRLIYQVSKKNKLTADVIDRIGDYYNRFTRTGGSS
ncbi:hypothetical protein [Paenibacillus arenosi]|uniref:Tetratricopeptide repeat protein n=1 Tax=Paenibacillus arenosi TaxID=2774142 RepID=A0ABR9B2Z8_9BACL|nr:hypothetical protein [Paenibacillus arenosi]MBD8500516.1 hypothetical protein [Paenibacillus arenosi]